MMKLYFREHGSGPPFVFLHGLFGSSDNLTTVARHFENDFRMLLVDQRNHGRSPHSQEFSYDLMAQDVKELLDELGINKIYLLGHSMGGKTAMFFARKYPEYVKKLIVVDMPPVGEYKPPRRILQGLNSLNLSSIESRGDADKQLAETVPEIGVRQFLLKNLERADSGFEWKMNLPVLTEKIDEIGKPLPDGTVEVPSLFIRGGNSDYIGDEDIKDIKGRFSDVKIVTVSGAGHWLHAEKPDQFLEAVSEFISD